MATRVQATGKVTVDFQTSASLTFATPPTVGNGLVIIISHWANSAFPTSCTDNRGNTYTLAVQRRISGPGVTVYYCSAVATSAAPFTVTISAGAQLYWSMCGVEISGVGAGLTVDQTASQTGTGTAVTTTATAALAASDALAVALCEIGANQTSITVESVSPTWTQEYEELNHTNHAVGEADTRFLIAASGTTQSGSWTGSTSGNWAAAIATFVVAAGADLAISVADTITVTEAQTVSLAATATGDPTDWYDGLPRPAATLATQPLVAVGHWYDGLPVALLAPAAVIPPELFVGVSDTITVAEATTLVRPQEPLAVFVGDLFFLLDRVVTEVSLTFVDTITVTDRAWTGLDVSAADTLTLTDPLTVQILSVLSVNVSDTIPLTERLIFDCNVQAVETIDFNDVLQFDPLGRRYYETIRVRDFVQLKSVNLYIDISDTITISEPTLYSQGGTLVTGVISPVPAVSTGNVEDYWVVFLNS